MSERWSPGIGDPSLGGWFTVFVYLLATILSFRAFRSLAPSQATGQMPLPRERSGWLALTILMAFLCVNKQLDLQSLFTQFGRDMARAERWYEERRAVQSLFIKGFAMMSGIIGILIMSVAWRARNRWIRLAALGTILISTYIVMRAASFHHFERVTDAWIMGVRYSWIFENIPVLMICFAAWKSTGPKRF